MENEDGGSSPDTPGGPQIADGFFAGGEKALEQATEGMLKDAKPVTRFVLKRIPGLPALVFDAAEFAQAPNKTRAAFGLVGGGLGATGGAALGALAGGVNAPIGAAIGATAGEGIGEQVYDEHRAAIDGFVDPKVAGVRRGIHDTEATIRQGLGDTASWLRARQSQVVGAMSR